MPVQVVFYHFTCYHTLSIKNSADPYFSIPSPPKSRHFVSAVLRTFDFVGNALEKGNTHFVRAPFFFERDISRFVNFVQSEVIHYISVGTNTISSFSNTRVPLISSGFESFDLGYDSIFFTTILLSSMHSIS